MIPSVKVRYEDRHGGRVAFVCIDRPEKLNSLSAEIMRAFTDLFHGLAADLHLRAVVLTGAGSKAFIGGADIQEMAALSGPAEARAFIALVHGCCRAIRAVPVPVIARINGFCLGAGLEVAASCDLRLAADTAVFGMPEVKLGLPSVVEAALLPSLIGWGRARRILYTGETFGAAEALAWGLVEEVHAQALMDAAVEDLIDKLLDAEPRAVQLQKALMQRWEELPVSGAIQAGIEAFEDAWTTDEPSRAMAAFLARRQSAKKSGR
ncbi:enoyl-CoA hydratase [Phenylobacterium hankyongense]|uniref:Enoyl-CoA hydratase n=1 Tax=Phenylobacterium hankyongense TaxID=1813876 RepID=A0A328AUR7_9CAUL|nr:enoyl-CoA hydratase [Phenylobacterium hankyongense]RAK58349.1 enoyl-CoA hydratase [Phenylobacterium hankyongense]